MDGCFSVNVPRGPLNNRCVECQLNRFLGLVQPFRRKHPRSDHADYIALWNGEHVPRLKYADGEPKAKVAKGGLLRLVHGARDGDDAFGKKLFVRKYDADTDDDVYEPLLTGHNGPYVVGKNYQVDNVFGREVRHVE